jgi:hypothetical protein
VVADSRTAGAAARTADAAARTVGAAKADAVGMAADAVSDPVRYPSSMSASSMSIVLPKS